MRKRTLIGIVAGCLGCLGVLAVSECPRTYSEGRQYSERVYGYMNGEDKTKYDSTGYYILGAGFAVGGF